MVPVTLSPYVHVVENRLIPDTVQHGIFHRLSGEVFHFNETIERLLATLKVTPRVWIDAQDLKVRGDPPSLQIKQLLTKEFLIPEHSDPLVSFADQYVVRPIQNPALAYRATDGTVCLVRTSMANHVFSPKKDELAAVIEETLASLETEIFLQADGTRTLREIFGALDLPRESNLFKTARFREAIDFLTDPDRQLIKFTSRRDDLADPYMPCNIVPRNLYHSHTWKQTAAAASSSIIDFHRHGIEDATWEFDLLEPTINHSFRFASEALDGFSYGGRFCCSTLTPEVVPLLNQTTRLNVLEVGGGTGTFARSFIEQARELRQVDITYHIMELSPTLIRQQQETLADYAPVVKHFQQDATKFDLPAQAFDLIIANEVIADFPVACVRRTELPNANSLTTANIMPRWEGEGAPEIERYDLMVDDAPTSFVVNSSVFRFLERAWSHLTPGGTLILTEYGGERIYPKLSFHLNHEEYSIHFGHMAACARKIGFNCRLLSLREFLNIHDQTLMLDGKEEQILCLNHVLAKFGEALPYALISKREFFQRYQTIVERTELTGITFSPLRTGFHYGPSVNDFMALILHKPG